MISMVLLGLQLNFHFGYAQDTGKTTVLALALPMLEIS